MAKKIPIILASLLMLYSTADAGVNPTSASWTLYKVYLYTSGDCTGTPETLLDSPTGTSFDFVSNPTLGSATVADGSYNCVAIKVSDTVSFVPSADDGASCLSGTTYTLDVCDSSWTYWDADASTTGSCTDSADTMWVYISTWSDGSVLVDSNNSFMPPTSSGDPTKGMALSNPVTVAGSTTGTFVIDTYHRVATVDMGGTNVCGMGRPSFGIE